MMSSTSRKLSLVARRRFRRRWQAAVVSSAAIALLLFLGTVSLRAAVTPSDLAVDADSRVRPDADPPAYQWRRRQLLQTTDNASADADTCRRKDTRKEPKPAGSLFPPDPLPAISRYFLLLHVAGLLYMFLALEVVCDEFFVPALGVLSETLGISDDVAGATFMAAGGSAPEFFTSLIGVFVAKDNVGIGTIVGSATFNILCVLAFCCLFSPGVLHLTWWPLFRDVSFYIVALALLVAFFVDGKIEWTEALALFVIYVAYCTFMKFNEKLEIWVKTTLLGHRLPQDEDATTDNWATAQNIVTNAQSIPMFESDGAQYNNGSVQVLLHTLDPLSELQVDDRMVRLQGMASVNVVIGRSALPSNHALHTATKQTNGHIVYHNNPTFQPDTFPGVPGTPDDEERLRAFVGTRPNSSANISGQSRSTSTTCLTGPPQGGAILYNTGTENGGGIGMMQTDGGEQPVTDAPMPNEEDEEVVEEPLDVSWPDEPRKWINYILLAPIIFPLYVTLPDVRKPNSRKYFAFSFIGCILWIAFFSYLMVWWAGTIGDVYQIRAAIMGLTILAMGTSIPDLITSVIVARKGMGDMAVSSSVGSNIFDVSVGMPIPWLLFFAVGALVRDPNAAEDPSQFFTSYVEVGSKGLVCSVGMLFFMLLLLVLAIGLFNWQMNKVFGVVMIFAYGVFTVVAVGLELGTFTCFITPTECG